jgi:drug/metabolite transporter (DMT)-like permease
MDIIQSLLSFVTIALAVMAGYFLFRRKPRQIIVSRIPLFMVCCLFLVAKGIGNLPLALPGVFERLLRHSVWMNYMPPVKLNVTQIGGTWWVVRWRDPIETGYFVVFLAGMGWALVNVIQRRARKLNVSCLCVGTLLLLVSFVWSFFCFPFCV